ncbi:MAG: hypothetical protein ACE5HV_03190 [Acidobacteriota bacterium]
MSYEMRQRWLPLTGCALLLLAACQTPPAPSGDQADTGAPAADGGSAEAGFAGAIEAAQGLEAWRAHPAIGADIVVTFRGNTSLDGRLVFKTDMGGSRVELADGTVAVFDGTDAWVSPASSSFQRARFHLLTWPYFFAVPMKLHDPGTHLEPTGEMQLQGQTYDTAKLTFGAGVGDSPDDWYVLFRDRETNFLHAMGFIVTYSKSVEEAEASPEAITYHDYTDVDGVRIPSRWKLWRWSPQGGIEGDPIGEVELSGVRFLEPGPETFARPPDSRRAGLPGES